MTLINPTTGEIERIFPYLAKEDFALPEYDPRMSALVARTDQDWGNPLDNRKNLVPYGFPVFDRELYGIDTLNGELILIIGEEKNRKTTFFLNIIANIMMNFKPVEKPLTAIDTLESGMRPEKVRDVLIAIVASRYLLQIGHVPGRACPACQANTCKELGISDKFLRYNTRTPLQEKMIQLAKSEVEKWPVLIYGPGDEEGDTRNLDKAKKRWAELSEMGLKILGVDHVQQYSFSDGTTSDYEKQVRSVAAGGDFVANKHAVMFMLSQVSLTSVRAAKQGQGRVQAAGGQKGTQEANVEYTVKYDDEQSEMKVSITAARSARNLSLYIPVERQSGAIWGDQREGV